MLYYETVSYLHSVLKGIFREKNDEGLTRKTIVQEECTIRLVAVCLSGSSSKKIKGDLLVVRSMAARHLIKEFLL